MSKNVKVFSKKVKMSSPLFDVVEFEIESKSGNKKRLGVDRKPVVYIFPITPNYDIYLTSQFRYAHGKNVIDGIAGYIDPGELPLNAAKRELKEEAGIIAQEFKKIAEIEVGAGVLKGIQYIYYAKGLTFGETEFDEDEDIDLIKLTLSEAVKKVINGSININACCLGILLLDKLKQEGRL